MLHVQHQDTILVNLPTSSLLFLVSSLISLWLLPPPDPRSSDCSDVDVQDLLVPCSCSDLLQPPRGDLHVSVDVAHLHEEVINAPEEEEPGHAEGD